LKTTEDFLPTSDKDDDADDDLTPAERRQLSRDRRRKPLAAPRSGRVSGGLALIFASAALILTGYLWYTLIYERPELVQMDLPGTLASLEQTTTELKSAADDTHGRIDALTETENTLKAAIDKMQADLGRNRATWAVSEAEQLLLIANRRLQLARDINSALAALRAADRQLELLASPNLLPVRRELAREIMNLESLERADVAGISLRLGTLAEGIDQLPLAADMRAAPEQTAAAQVSDANGANGREAKANLWKDLMSLVRVRRYENAPRPPLPPEQQYYARENFRLMLYGAQHALLQGNAATYQQNLKTASAWINDYFDRNSPAVAAMQTEIEKMRATPVMTQLPDISPSLDMLRKVSGRRDES
jgi:uroporphyrin-III C-methyltransferase